uniref:HDC15759 n=1 Tax=Drosophila melanogaster TaxID=7227 RepID=Q6IJ71_DROME|nr:TPA_inf: HDC15759 [Drosophila melanogaster]
MVPQRCQCQSHTYMIPNMPMPKANISGNNKCSCNTSNIHGSSMQLLATKEQEHRTQSTEPRSTENRESSNQSLKFHAHNLFKDSLNIGQASSAVRRGELAASWLVHNCGLPVDDFWPPGLLAFDGRSGQANKSTGPDQAVGDWTRSLYLLIAAEALN